jgi:hypothetical protein
MNSESIDRKVEEKKEDINVLSGDNKVGVEIEPDVKSNDVYLQICSCSLILSCFNKEKDKDKEQD